MRLLIPLALSLILLASCQRSQAPILISANLIDQNGLSEIIQSKDRLANIAKVNFLAPQPYQKVLRTFSKNERGQTFSILTSYHQNGHLKQYLEAIDHRACGCYCEWFPNGERHVFAHVISGHADLTFGAEGSWIFDQTNLAWNAEGILVAEIPYDKGVLHGESRYYYDTGELAKKAPYYKGELNGLVQLFERNGFCTRQENYRNGHRNGPSASFWGPNTPRSCELYCDDHLVTAQFFDPSGRSVAEVIEGCGWCPTFKGTQLVKREQIQEGLVQGRIEEFDDAGTLIHTYNLFKEVKMGDEIFYYPNGKQMMLLIQWKEGLIQGICRTWYSSGLLESERHISQNQKNGPSKAWYPNGNLMMREEYEQDHLLSGQYFSPTSRTPVSVVENGRGVVTIYTEQGQFLRRITYNDGIPQNNNL